MEIRPAAWKALVDHALKDAPIEACGYLEEEGGVLAAALPLSNLDRSPEHFSFDPAEQFAALKAARSRGRRLAAVYHSHPASPARLSEEDLRLLRDPAMLYLVCSLEGPEPVVKAFWTREGRPQEEPLVLLPS